MSDGRAFDVTFRLLAVDEDNAREDVAQDLRVDPDSLQVQPAHIEYEDLQVETETDWREKNRVTQVDCAACDETHEITYYPVPDAPIRVGEKEINDHRGDCYLLSVGICPNADRLVSVYATRDGWECPPGCEIDHVDEGDDGDA